MVRDSWTKEEVAKSERIDLQDRISEAIIAIDTELITVKNTEYRKVLVNTGYALRDLILNIQRLESLEILTSKADSRVA